MKSDKTFRHKTVGQVLEELINEYGGREVMIYGSERYRYNDLKEKANAISKGLINLGVNKGTKVGIWLPNYPEWIILQLAITQIGAVLVPLNTRYKSFDLKYIINQAGIEILFTTDKFMKADYYGIIEKLCPNVVNGQVSNATTVPTLREVIFVRNEREVHQTLEKCIISGQNVSGSILYQRIEDTDADETMYLLFTSGTTGNPKGAMRTPDNVLQHAYDVGNATLMQPGDKVLGVIPFCGAWGCSTIIPSTLLHGACVVIQDYFDVEIIYSLIERERITLMHGVDVMFEAMADYPQRHLFDIFSLKKAMVANFGSIPALMDRVIEDLKVEQATQALGMTELNACYLMLGVNEPVADRKRVAGGKPMPNIHVKIVDPVSWNEVKYGETGEICAKGYTLFSGYYNGPEETSKVMDDGWFHTGDLGFIDDQGLVNFVGRLKEMYKSNGFNVTPREVEEFLLTHSAIEEVGVVGVPHPQTGQTGMAFIKLRDGQLVSQREIFEYCRGKVASFKIPRYVEIIEKLPKVEGPHGNKLSKVELQKLAKIKLKNNHNVKEGDL